MCRFKEVKNLLRVFEKFTLCVQWCSLVLFQINCLLIHSWKLSVSSASFSLRCCKLSWLIVSNVTQNSIGVSVEAVATAQSSRGGSLVDSPSLQRTIGKLDGTNILRG